MTELESLLLGGNLAKTIALNNQVEVVAPRAIEGARADTPAPVALADQATPDQAPAIPRRVVGDSVPVNIRLDKIEYVTAYDNIFSKDQGDLGSPKAKNEGLRLGRIDTTPSNRVSFVIAHVRNTPLRLRAWFTIDPPETGRIHCIVTASLNKTVKWGQALPPEDRGLTFSSEQVDVRGPIFSVDLRCLEPATKLEIPLMNAVKRLRDVELIWKMELMVFSDSANSVPMRLPYGPWYSKADIFLTMGTPIDSGKVSRAEDGVTTERLYKTYSFIEKLDTTDAHTLCAAMLPKLGKIVLKPNAALKKFSHPDYFENKADVKGGAWNLLDHLGEAERGECQAMVRLMRAILYLIGAVSQPENAAVVVVYAKPDNPAIADTAIEDSELDAKFLNAQDVVDTGGLHAFTKQEIVSGNPENWQAMLMSKVIQAGDKLPQSQGFNFYEAALKVNSNGKTAYYAGGLFNPFSSNTPILKIHVALCWVADTDKDPVTQEPRKIIRKVIQGYRDFNHVKPKPVP